MHRKRPDVDIIKDVLGAAVAAYPDSTFIQSLALQYDERGGLSKKQLEGLYQKARKIKDIPLKWLATLEAEILKKPTRFRSVLPPNAPLYEKDKHVGEIISLILGRYPSHKRVLFLKSKFENNEPLSAAELTELKRLNKLLG